MLLEIAIGDAYGAGFEFAAADFVLAHNRLQGYTQHPSFAVQAGNYTDDTQMSLALAELLLTDCAWAPQEIANQFVTGFKRDPREGYARRFYAFLQTVEDGTAFLAKIRPNSAKNGAAMRAVPLGLLPTVSAVTEHCATQAAITHNTPAGIDAALAVSLMAHYCIYRLGPKAELPDFLFQHLPREWQSDWQAPVTANGIETVNSVLTALLACDTMSGLLQQSISFTGDVDSVAAIALGIGAHCAEIRQDLPRALYDTLEEGMYGKSYLCSLDRRLYQKYNLVEIFSHLECFSSV